MKAQPGILLAAIASLALLGWVLVNAVETKTASTTKAPMAPLTRLERPGLANLHALAHGIYSGGLPQGEAGFQSLTELGVRTVISVDGAEPDLAMAEAAGMRYVHLPIGYDGIPRMRIVQLAAVLRELPGPIYIHCHRGLHRGPAATLAACRAAGILSQQIHVESLLKEMGTAPKYAGLYRDVLSARPITTKERQSVRARELPNHSAVAPLTHQMVELERAWENWTHDVTRDTEWSAERTASAVALAERLVEAGRLLDDDSRPAALRSALIADGRWLGESAESNSDSPESLAKLMRQRCEGCHARFRDH